MEKEELKSKYILWTNHGYDGWSPTPFPSLKEALAAEKYTANWIITSGKIDFDVKELPPNS